MLEVEQKIDKNLLKKLRDPKWYLENLTKIKTKQVGALAPFKLKEAQKDLFNTLRKHPRVIILKARQLGMSTAMVGWIYHNTIMNPGTTSAIIGYNSDLTAELLDKVKTFYKTTPEQLKPTIHYNTKNEITFPRMDSKILVLPSTENVGRGYTLSNVLCVSGSTKVFMRDGITKEVKNVRSGDFIVNGKGGLSKVKEVIKRKNHEKLLKLSIVGSDSIRLTKDHKVLCRGNKEDGYVAKWKRADEIKINNSRVWKERFGDRIAYPYFQVRENRVKSIKINDFIKKGYKSRSSDCFCEIKTDYNFGLFAGWYLAEGHINENKNRIVFCVHANEIKTILSVIEPFKQFYGKIRIETRKESFSTTVTIEGTNFARFIESIFGRLKNKRISDCIWYWGKDFVDGLLFGVFAGDGHFNDLQKVQLTNTNESIIYQVKKLLVSRRYGLASVSRRETFRYGKQGLDRYDLLLCGPGNYKFRKRFGLELPKYNNNFKNWFAKLKNCPNANLGAHSWRRGRFYYWARIKKVEEVESEEFIYDIVLEKNPHSFLTTSGVVHNCTELSSWEKAEEKMITLEASVPINGRIVIESSPRGTGNYYHRMWAIDNDYVKKKYGWWWEYSLEDIEIIRRRMNNPQKFAQEYSMEFLTSGRPVFDPNVILEQRKNILEVGDVVKTEDGKDYTVKVENDLIIYKEPTKEDFFVIGADISEGVSGGDYSVATVFNRRTGEQVGFFRGFIPPDRFGEKLDVWGRRFNNALMVPEVNNHGLTTLTVLRQRLYPTMYFRPAKFEGIGMTNTNKLGWRTTSTTRPLLIDEFAQACRDRTLTIHSKEILDEMSVFVYDNNGDMVSQPGFKDDSIFAAGISLQGFKMCAMRKLEQIDYTKELPSSFNY